MPVSEEGAQLLGATYWRHVERSTGRIVRTRAAHDRVELRALGVVLLAFGPAETRVTDEEIVCSFQVRGGVLARRPGGALTLSHSTGTPPEVRSVITGFFPRLAAPPGRPRWAGWAYSQVQRRIHQAISRRYFRRLDAQGDR